MEGLLISGLLFYSQLPTTVLSVVKKKSGQHMADLVTLLRILFIYAMNRRGSIVLNHQKLRVRRKYLMFYWLH